MILIGENINIMSTTIGAALKGREAGPVQEMARAEAAAGMDYLDLNIGPARREGDLLMDWTVRTVQAVSDNSLSLDTANPVAMEAGLKACRGRALINSISLQPERLGAELPLVTRYGAAMIGLLWGSEGMPRDAAERGVLAAELLYRTAESGIAGSDVWIDPILTPITVGVNQIQSCLEFMGMLGDIAPECQSVVGLSNVSNGVPRHLRPYLNRTCLMMLMKHGLKAAIVDAFDEELVDIARGRKPELVKLVHSMMEGARPDISSLSPEEIKYVRTVRVLAGETLFSESWLES